MKGEEVSGSAVDGEGFEGSREFGETLFGGANHNRRELDTHTECFNGGATFPFFCDDAEGGENSVVRGLEDGFISFRVGEQKNIVNPEDEIERNVWMQSTKNVASVECDVLCQRWGEEGSHWEDAIDGTATNFEGNNEVIVEFAVDGNLEEEAFEVVGSNFFSNLF